MSIVVQSSYSGKKPKITESYIFSSAERAFLLDWQTALRFHNQQATNQCLATFDDAGFAPPLLFPLFFKALQNGNIEVIEMIAGKIESQIHTQKIKFIPRFQRLSQIMKNFHSHVMKIDSLPVRSKRWLKRYFDDNPRFYGPQDANFKILHNSRYTNLVYGNFWTIMLQASQHCNLNARCLISNCTKFNVKANPKWLDPINQAIIKPFIFDPKRVAIIEVQLEDSTIGDEFVQFIKAFQNDAFTFPIVITLADPNAEPSQSVKKLAASLSALFHTVQYI
eukprot:TRINITY_DN3956_c0_g1_i2.p1 TRINITY_DN3956_c0_g1~~TRINITY_DN3956_c0_g1_i2.p1  ORF type:complete len:279 (-),score=13.89 TRINITY_DN3956_c0_g1_i2:83-919(-)